MNRRQSAVVASLALAVLLLGGCASSGRTTQSLSPQIDEILSQTDAAAAALRRCLPTSQYSEVEIIDEQRLLFRGTGTRAWVNHLRQPCRSLRRNDTLLFELRTGQACALDRASVIDRNFLFWSRSGPICSLGEFQPISPEQLTMIEDVLKGNRRD